MDETSRNPADARGRSLLDSNAPILYGSLRTLSAEARAARGALHPPAFYGRDTECRTFLDWLARSARGCGIVAVVTGDPGIGKSTLLERMRGLARAHGSLVTELTAMPAGVPVPQTHHVLVLADGIAADDAELRARAAALARRTSVHALTFVLALDAEDPLGRELVRRGAQHLALGALAETEIARFVRAHRDAAGIVASRIDEIVRAACGNPRHARELIAAHPPRSLATALERIAAGTGNERALRLLTCVAVATDDRLVVDRRLARALASRQSDVDEALDAARRVRFLRGNRFVDALTRDVAEAALGPAVRTDLHARAALALSKRVPAEDAPALGLRLVRHYGLGGSPHRAASLSLALADEDAASGRFALARDGYRAALAFDTLDDATSARAGVALARASEAIGETVEALHALRSASTRSERGGDREGAIDAALRFARLAFEAGDAASHGEALARVAALTDGSPDSPAYVRHLLGCAGYALISHRKEQSLAALAALEMREPNMPTDVHVRFLALRAMHSAIFAAANDGAPPRDDARAAIAEAESAGLWRDAGFIYANVGCTELAAGRTARAKAAMSDAVDRAVRSESTDLLVHEFVDLASIAILEGDFERAESFLQRPEFERAPVLALAKRAWPAARLSTAMRRSDLIDVEQARRWFEASSRIGSVEDVLFAGGALALLLDRNGDPEAGLVADRAIEGLVHTFITFDVVAFVAPIGGEKTVERARDLVSALRPSHDPRIVEGMLDLLDLLVAQRAGGRGTARAKRLGRRAARAFESLGWTFFRYEAFVAAGCHTEAADLANRLRLAASASVVPGLIQLTKRETAIARRVSAGARNADLARELGISASTVEKHVSSILEKYGLRSRHEIRSVLEVASPSGN